MEYTQCQKNTINYIIKHIKYIKVKNKRLYYELIKILKENGSTTLKVLKQEDISDDVKNKAENLYMNNINKINYMTDWRTMTQMEANFYINKFYEYLHSAILNYNHIKNKVNSENNDKEYKVTTKADIDKNGRGIEIQAQFNITDYIYIKKYKMDNLIRDNAELVIFDKINYFSYYSLNTLNINIGTIKIAKGQKFGGKEYYCIPTSFFTEIDYL